MEDSEGRGRAGYSWICECRETEIPLSEIENQEQAEKVE
jgi:hypothetical protein